MSLARTHGKASSPPLVPSLHLVLWGFGLGDYYHLLFIYDTEEQGSLFSHVVYTPHGCILTCSGSKQCSSFRAFCPDMPCSLCGRQHNLRTCKLPGAAKHRELLANFRHVAGKVKNPQEGRKPPRLGPVTWGRKREKLQRNTRVLQNARETWRLTSCVGERESLSRKQRKVSSRLWKCCKRPATFHGRIVARIASGP